MSIIDNKSFSIPNRNNADPTAIAQLDLALAYIQGSFQGAKVIDQALLLGKVTINLNNDFEHSFDPTTRTISWDPRGALIVGAGTGTQSPALQLAHEIAHAADTLYMISSPNAREIFAHDWTSQIATQLGEPTRADYNDVQGWQNVANATQHSVVINGQSHWSELSQSGSQYIDAGYSQAPNIYNAPIGPAVVAYYINPFGCSFGYWMPEEEDNPQGRLVYVVDPVVVNFVGGKVAMTSVDNSSIRFDLQNNGDKLITSWLTEGEGFLVFDQDRSGTIDSVKDLVGNLGALIQLDSNHDGKLNALDAQWDKLAVWADTHQGQFSSTDLHTLAELNIVEIDLHIQAVADVSSSNVVVNRADIVFTNGSVGEIASVALIGLPDAQAVTA